MPHEPPSQMIRVPTPLVDVVRELSRLHRAGRTKAVVEGVERLVAAIDSEADIDIDSVSESISMLTKRLEHLESERIDSKHDIDIDSVLQPISERLEKVEIDIESLAMMIAHLDARVPEPEGGGDIDCAVTPLSEQEPSNEKQITEPLSDIDIDSSVIAEAANQDDITTDIGQIAESQSLAPLTQTALAKRLGYSDKAIEKHRKQGSKEGFAVWSRQRDPDGIAWTWEGSGGRGQPLRFVPMCDYVSLELEPSPRQAT